MSDGLTDEQLHEWLERYPESRFIVEFLALRARVGALEAALKETIPWVWDPERRNRFADLLAQRDQK